MCRVLRGAQAYQGAAWGLRSGIVSNLGLQANSDIEITKEDKNGIEVRGGNPCFIAYTVRVCVYVCGEGGGFGCLQITNEG